MPENGKEKFVIIDGNSLIHRAFYALPATMRTGRGEQTNAVYGFLRMLFRLFEEEQPDYIAVAVDPPGPSFRREIYADYKGQRQKTPPELGEQMARTREVLEAMRIPIFELPGFEADDVIGTLAAQAGPENLETIIVSGDADLLQLIDDAVTVLLTRRGITSVDRCNRTYMQERFGLTPEQWVDYKALKGDPSDNIPGIPGIGDKTARRLLADHGSVEQILEALPLLKGKLRQNLEENRALLATGQELNTIRRDLPLQFTRDCCRRSGPDHEKLLALFEELDFKSFAADLAARSPGLGEKETPEPQPLYGEPVTAPGQLAALLERFRPGARMALLAEPSPGRPYWRSPPTLLAFAFAEGSGYYLEPAAFTDPAELWAIFGRAFERGGELIGHEVKYLYSFFEQVGLKEPPFEFDCRVAAYLLDPGSGRYELEYLAADYAGAPAPAVRSRRSEPLPLRQRGLLLANHAAALFAIQERLTASLRERDLEQLYCNLELPLAAVLASMERQGIAIDLQLLRDLTAEIHSRIDALETKIHTLAGEEFNLNSPQQLAVILFEKLKLPVVRKTKTGYSTDARVLAELAPHHQIVAEILHYRQLIKLEGTYLSGLLPLVDEEERKIYTTFNQTVTATGRLSSSEPNLQNIPIRLEEGRRIRGAFIPSRRRCQFLAADYSQIELRVLAHLSGDPILLDAFHKDEDIHRRTAAEVFQVAPEEVTAAMRRKAKAVNFGIIYGISDYGLAQGLGVSRQEARSYIESYFNRYEGVREYMEKVIARAGEDGYVTTLLGRRRYLPEIRASHFGRRSFAERTARNTPVQGSAADIIKLAMLRVDRTIRGGGFDAALLLQIHDELLFEVDAGELDFFAPVIRRDMEQALALEIPLKVDLRSGENWAALEPWGQ
ncbi:MAG: DNA polymerase I [Firmicutes bacterium]|nr:DNA polymerase I [Bacillota bacterium]